MKSRREVVTWPGMLLDWFSRANNTYIPTLSVEPAVSIVWFICSTSLQQILTTILQTIPVTGACVDTIVSSLKHLNYHLVVSVYLWVWGCPVLWGIQYTLWSHVYNNNGNTCKLMLAQSEKLATTNPLTRMTCHKS